MNIGDKFIFDTETTGLPAPAGSPLARQPQIIEIFCLRLNKDNEIVGEFESFLKPTVPISDKITQITGITNEMVKDAPSFAEIYGKLVDVAIGCTEMIAHNVKFDQQLLQFELERIDRNTKFPWPFKHTCTVQRTMGIQGKRLKLEVLYELATGNKMMNAHRAKDDVMALYEAYLWCVKEGYCK